jgi:hypothetical protein
MSTPYNPEGRTDNCGFCAIAHGLCLQNAAAVVTADQLYSDTLERLGLEREGNRDPIPRQLIFPEPMLHSIPVSVAYDALSERTLGLSSYTITAVAEASGLRFNPAGDLDLVRQFVQGFSNHGRWSIHEFVEARLDFLRSQGKNPNPRSLERHVLGGLVGHSIMGSKTKDHFLNAHIDGSGFVQGFDAQDGTRHDGRGLMRRLGSVDLFMRLPG